MAKTELLPEEAKRIAVYNEMTPKLQKVAEQFDKMESAAVKGTVLIGYDMGVKLKEVLDRAEEYGADSVDQLAQYLGRTETEFYQFINVVAMYTRDEVIALAEKKMADGRRISWMHLTAIVEIKRAPDRKAMWTRIFNESLSASQVKNEALATLDKGGRRGLGGGRKPSQPKSPLAAYQDIYSIGNTFNNKIDGWQAAAFDAVDEIEPDKVDPRFVEKIKLALDQVEAMSGNIGMVQERLQTNLARAETIVQKHLEDAETAANEAAAEAEAETAAEAETNEDGEASESEDEQPAPKAKTKKTVEAPKAKKRSPAKATA